MPSFASLHAFVPAALAAVFVIGAPGAASAGDADNFHDFPEYPQTLRVEFADAAGAEAARLVVCPLPDGKPYAFTVRGDDSNGIHRKVAETLAAHGFKGGFLLNEVSPDYAEKTGRAFLAAGSSAGNHSRSHPRLGDLMPYAIFDEIVLHQARIESALDTASVSFTLPFGVADNPVDPATAGHVAEALRRAGIFASTEGKNLYRFPEDAYFGSRNLGWFEGYDSHPNIEKMEERFQEALADVRKAGPGARIAYGTHSYYRSDAGLAALGEWFAKHRDDPELWPCNDNEYGAYRYAFHRARPVKTVEGKTAVFTLRRLSAADLGSEIPLEVRLDGGDAPLSVTLDGRALAATPENGRWRLPGPGRVPQRIDFPPPGVESSKIPGLRLALDYDEGADGPHGSLLRLRLHNGGEQALEDVEALFTAPLRWKTGHHRQRLARLEAGETRILTCPLDEEEAPESTRIIGPASLLARVDFMREGTPLRIYAACRLEGEAPAAACPRDTALQVGPVPDEALTEEVLAALSKPSTPLAPFGPLSHEQWTHLDGRARGFREFVVTAQRVRPEQADDPAGWEAYRRWDEETRPYFQKKVKGSRLFVLEFTAEADGEAILACPTHPNNLSEFHLNGVRHEFQWRNQWNPLLEQSIPVNRGTNRLLFVNPITSDWTAKQFCLSVGLFTDKERRPLPCESVRGAP